MDKIVTRSKSWSWSGLYRTRALAAIALISSHSLVANRTSSEYQSPILNFRHNNRCQSLEMIHVRPRWIIVPFGLHTDDWRKNDADRYHYIKQFPETGHTMKYTSSDCKQNKPPSYRLMTPLRLKMMFFAFICHVEQSKERAIQLGTQILQLVPRPLLPDILVEW